MCIYEEMQKKGYMYVWTVNVASRGGQEIGSCLLNHLRTRLQPGVKKIILYSDSCGGQNRNIKVAMMLKHFLASSKVDFIAQRFFLSGHSYNSCDRCFSFIEKKSREKEAAATPDA
ncbi:uncharacterized protein LOC117170240 [Belonocnema kinseyi]|uniref:uncharacterized protein LOC117170240 n=1 Tax=Belonocnema kinseyi TaxID=2817044 RepID=UPI00143D52EC|nr:uncharacterized protein LOC117170240 [Belonocnema kinseyi]